MPHPGRLSYLVAFALPMAFAKPGPLITIGGNFKKQKKKLADLRAPPPGGSPLG
ncbi:hypothetical protein DSO57_1036501 [Entomophthora muscae]|uniref:Uncharacterized protein n=1 Tax=Entomophthora muscae TaxID=34485 RepID=A0ACC2U9B4_9FUNG|nr:hypothetical protein DSO57_1036501 [Entomophthora muscae]